MNHTSGPWHIGMKPGPTIYGPKGEQVMLMHNPLLEDAENIANTRHIVHCVNTYGVLVEALRVFPPMPKELDNMTEEEMAQHLERVMAWVNNYQDEALALAEKGAV